MSVLFNLQTTGHSNLKRIKEDLEDKTNPVKIKDILEADGLISLCRHSWLFFIENNLSDCK